MSDINEEISSEQALKYAREVSRLYRLEKERRKQLEEAYAELEALRKKLEVENIYLRDEVNCELAYGHIAGESLALKKVLREVELVAESDATVLILGETGTGKELIARAIHERSKRKDRPLIKVNCGAIPKELFESEFFGHVKGAFTGAVRDRIGRFQLAHAGTLFLDEVAEIPLELQNKLLRVLQDGQFEKVGDESTVSVDVRIIVATNKDLMMEVENGSFREDLYYRLSVFPIEVPPLRQREDDIKILASHFVNQICQKHNKRNIKITETNFRELQAYCWPGNIRELQNVIERAILTSTDGNLAFNIRTPHHSLEQAIPAPARPTTISSEQDRKAEELNNLQAALEKTNWKIYGKGGAGELLGIQPATLAYRIKKLGLKRPR